VVTGAGFVDKLVTGKVNSNLRCLASPLFSHLAANGQVTHISR